MNHELALGGAESGVAGLSGPLSEFLLRLRRAVWQRVRRVGSRPIRRLRLCESLALGDRRFVAVVEFERARFLIGATPSSMVLLTRLEIEAGAIEASRETERTSSLKEACN